MPRVTVHVLLVAGCVVLIACSAPVPATSDQPLPELAEPASPLPQDQQPDGPAPSGGAVSVAPTSSPTASLPPGDPATTPGSDPTAPPPSAADTPRSSSPTPSAPGAEPLVVVDDPTGDAGLEAPDYADLVRVGLADTGSDLRVTVDVVAALPATLQDGEVIGLGVNLFTSSEDESDYQLFADGGSDGWRAYLQTPEGFVDYPGTFALGGRRLVFQVPWTAVGAPARAEVTAFLDWSQRRPVVNAASSDRAPDDDRAPFSRA